MTTWLEQQVKKAGLELIYRDRLVELVKRLCQDVVDYNVRPQKALRIDSAEALTEFTQLHAILLELRQIKEVYNELCPSPTQPSQTADSKADI